MSNKQADSITELDLDSENKAVRCPKCGSHTLRAFNFDPRDGGNVTLKCLTCHNEFERPAFRNPEAKTSGAAHKFVPGHRVQMTHPHYKGERGSIMGYSGKHADLGEEQYEIQLDSGEKITNIPESAFKKIKSAKVGEDLPDTASRFFLDSMKVYASPPPGDSSKPKTLPLTEWDDNDTDADYDPDVQDDRYDLPEDEDVSCPMCSGPGNALGDLGSRTYYRCRNCGMDWSHPRSDESEKWNYDNDPTNLFGQDKPSYSHIARTDTRGNKLEAGRVYLMKGKNYTVPDLVRILNLEESRIEATIASDVKGAFPIIIEAKDEGDYSFDPVEEKGDAEVRSGNWKVARKTWSAQEQRELIEENPKARARNFDKLDLSGTHYESRASTLDDDPDFLWGM